MAAFSLVRALCGASLIAISSPAFADTIFTPSQNGFVGSVNAGGVQRGTPVLPGSKAAISGQGLVAGQQITLMRGNTVLNTDGPITVDPEGAFRFELDVDADAAVGLQPILVIAENPAAATVADLKISPEVPLSGQDGYEVRSAAVVPGLYQVALGGDALFVTSAVGRPPVRESKLNKINPDTLEIIAQTAPEALPDFTPREGDTDTRPAVFAIYGLGLDKANGNVWVTNTRQDTIAVYKQDDLSLVKQFDQGAVNHARDVIVDDSRGRAYAGATQTSDIEVFDTATLDHVDTISIPTTRRGDEFSVMSLALDSAGGKLLTVSMTTDELAVVDLASGEVSVFPLAGARGASGVAYDAQDKLAFVASQSSDNLLIVNAEDGTVLHDVPTGAGALNVTFDPVSRLAWVANRGARTLTAVNTDGKIVANLDGGSLPNHLIADGDGGIWAVNKSLGEDDETGDRIWHILPKAN